MRLRATYKKSESRRRQVIDAAIRTLAKRGFSRTSVEDIAATAGMSKGVVHYHFKSKEDLLVQVTETCFRRIDERVRVSWEAPGPPSEKIRSVLRESWSVRQEGGPEVRVLTELTAQAIHDPKLRKSLAALFHAARVRLIEEFVTAFRALGLKPRIPAHIIPRLVIGMFDGLALHNLFDPPSIEDEEQIIHALELIAFALFEL
jgi:AcrR family transcriptional regulator